ncbi:MAG: transporter substrate-binding protein [Clostridiales Family XIII bacterium]|jgi:ABC-type branched-subunit amino acid transport system substrate-binding protein|nr:transporter substrate-binding protein [Clostridiales Family XIII bacterium]
MKSIFKRVAAAVLIGAMLPGVSACGESDAGSADEIKIGLIYAHSGSAEMIESLSEKAALLAINEINDAGGINGKQLTAVSEDWESDEAKATEKAKKLYLQDGVNIILGTCLGTGTQAVRSVAEENGKLFIAPTAGSGEDESPNMIFTGGTTYTFTKELIPFMAEKFGNRVFCVGSDYYYPVRIEAQTKALIDQIGGELVGSAFLPMEATDCSAVITKIMQAKPDFVYANVVGSTTATFYQQMKEYGLDIPIASVITSEMDAITLGGEYISGSYSAFNWFASSENPLSVSFLENFEKAYGRDDMLKVNATITASYSSIYLIAEALKSANSQSTDDLKAALATAEVDTPQGMFSVDAENAYYAKNYAMIIEWNDQARPVTVFASENQLPAEPWPVLLFPNGKP